MFVEEALYNADALSAPKRSIMVSFDIIFMTTIELCWLNNECETSSWAETSHLFLVLGKVHS